MAKIKTTAAAVGAALLGVLATQIEVDLGIALDASECDCPPDLPIYFVHDKKCFAQRQDSACAGKANMHPLAEGVWCWDGRRTTQCRTRGNGYLKQLYLALPNALPSALVLWPAVNRLSMMIPGAAAAARGCSRQNAALGGASASQKPSEAEQEAIVWVGLHRQAIGAMRTYPHDWEVQSACGQLLTSTVSWNENTATRVADDGGQEAVLDFLDRNVHLPSVQRRLGELGLWMDGSEANRHRFRELGGFTRLFGWVQKHYNGDVLCNLQNIVSTQTPMENRELLVSKGYMPTTVQAMRDFPGSCARGEGVWDIANLFLDKPEWVDEWYRLGLIEEVIKLFQDEPDAHDAGRSLDPLGTHGKAGMCRLLHSSMRVLGGLAHHNATRRGALLSAGFVDAIATMMRRVGDLRYKAVWGGSFDTLEQACTTLTDLVREDPEVNLALTKSGVLEQVSLLMARRSHDDQGRRSCDGLLKASSSSP